MMYKKSFILLLSWATLMQICIGQKDFLTIYDDRCITNTPSATAMIYDFSGTKITDNFVIQDVVEMKSLKEYNDAEIKGISDTCFKKNSDWRYAKLFDNLRTNNLIKDRRWEEFETFVTSKTNAPMLFKLNGHRSLSFSLQTEEEANIFLCDREEINNANCYEIILQDQKIELAVCERGQIARYNGNMSNTCKMLTQKWSKRKISGESWSHFKIKIDKEIYLEDQNGLNIFSWHDKNLKDVYGYVYFYTTKIGFWKVHFFQYIYTQEKITIESHKELTFPRGKNCLAMFAAMCQSCRLKFEIVIYRKWSRNEVLETFEIKSGEEWKEFKHTFNVNDEAKAYLYITTEYSRYQNPFWALNKIRSCNEQEARVLKPAYPNIWTQKCQLLNNGQIVEINNSKKTSFLEKCTEKQFGENCLSCEIFFNGKECPKGKKYCYSSINGDANSQEKCYCSIGYEGQDCSKPCASGTYGHGCQKSSKNCQDGCRNDLISGKCDSGLCTRNYYFGEKCDKPPNKIEQLELPSKGSTHLSFRWLPPHPPTGQLTEYRFSYCASRYTTMCPNTWASKKFKPTPCKLWPHYHCYKLIFESSKFYVYHIEMESKNMGCVDYSKPITTIAYADDKKISEPPNDLSMMWTKENHLNVGWYHPNVTNGVISRFILYVNHAPYEYPVGSEDNYLPVYHRTIKSPLALPDDYIVTVTAVNLAGESKEALIKGPSPPPFPIYDDYISTIRDKNFSISIAFNNFKEYKKTFQQFLYVLITECGICRDLATSYANDLVRHHESQYTVKSVESIKVQSWKAIIAYNTRDLKDHSDRTLRIGNNSISGNNKDVLYEIKPNTTYSLAFIWIHKLENYIRMNYTFVRVDIGDPFPPKPSTTSFSTGAIVILIFLLSVILILIVLFIRWKKEIYKKIGLLRRDNTTTSNEASVGVQYENYPLHAGRVNLNLDVICPGNTLFTTEHSRRVSHEVFQEYVRGAHHSDALSRQHSLIPDGQTRPWTYGALPQNMSKNRDKNLPAYDHSRVVLNKIEGDEYSDYINASYIDGYQMPRAYIATQCPTRNTKYDFWRMIWQEKVTYIVMMIHVREDSEDKYWPDKDHDLDLTDFKIKFISSKIYANFECKKFQLIYQNSESREVVQLHFKAAPNHTVPLYPHHLVPILQKMLTFSTANFPIVVHCSIGVERTGTVILSDICLRMAAAEGFVDVLAMFEHLRNQRAGIVYDIDQYTLAHLVILNCLEGSKSHIPIDENFTITVEECLQHRRMISQLKYIRDCEWEEHAVKTLLFRHLQDMPMDPKKNRFPHITADSADMFVRPSGDHDFTHHSIYINAVPVDAFCEANRFIVTQFPLPNTLGDFWRLICERNISVVVCLNDIPLDDKSCQPFFPTEFNELDTDRITTVRHVNTKHLEVYTHFTFEVMVSYSPRKSTVEIVKFRGWKASKMVPDDYMDFITFVKEATKVARQSFPTIITCYDGATASGLFVAMSFLLEQIKWEQACDVCQAARSIRTYRKEFINNEEQLKFLYKATLLYAEHEITQYANVGVQ